jgi:hypothetical protein
VDAALDAVDAIITAGRSRSGQQRYERVRKQFEAVRTAKPSLTPAASAEALVAMWDARPNLGSSSVGTYAATLQTVLRSEFGTAPTSRFGLLTKAISRKRPPVPLRPTPPLPPGGLKAAAACTQSQAVKGALAIMAGLGCRATSAVVVRAGDLRLHPRDPTAVLVYLHAQKSWGAQEAGWAPIRTAWAVEVLRPLATDRPGEGPWELRARLFPPSTLRAIYDMRISRAQRHHVGSVVANVAGLRVAAQRLGASEATVRGRYADLPTMEQEVAARVMEEADLPPAPS